MRIWGWCISLLNWELFGIRQLWQRLLGTCKWRSHGRDFNFGNYHVRCIIQVPSHLFFFGRYHLGIIQLSLVVMRIGSLESNRKFLLMILFGLHSSHLKIEHSFISACLVIFQELYLYTPTVYIIYIIHIYKDYRRRKLHSGLKSGSFLSARSFMLHLPHALPGSSLGWWSSRFSCGLWLLQCRGLVALIRWGP